MTTQQEMHAALAGLNSIAKAIGPGAAYDLLLDDSTIVEVQLPLVDLLRAIPRYFHNLSETQAFRRPRYGISIPNLFQQLENGNPKLRMSEVIDAIPSHYIGYVPDDLRSELVDLDQERVVAALWPDENIL